MVAAVALDESLRRRRRRRIASAITLGVAAVGVPALWSLLVGRRRPLSQSAAWARTRRYAWRTGSVAFQSLGDQGPPLLLLHDFGPGFDSRQWSDAAPVLARSFRVFAPDLPGWGRSDKPDVLYTPELYLDFVADFLASVIREPAFVVGVGPTAGLALATAVDLEDLVLGLGLVSPTGLRREHDRDRGPVERALGHLLSAPVISPSAISLATSRSAITRFLRREVFAAPERVDARLVEHCHHSCRQPGSHRALARFLAGALQLEVASAWRRLRRPALLVWGREAIDPPIEVADLWLHHRPETELEVFAGCGRLPHAELPAAFSLAIERFVDRVTIRTEE